MAIHESGLIDILEGLIDRVYEPGLVPFISGSYLHEQHESNLSIG